MRADGTSPARQIAVGVLLAAGAVGVAYAVAPVEGSFEVRSVEPISIDPAPSSTPPVGTLPATTPSTNGRPPSGAEAPAPVPVVQPVVQPLVQPVVSAPLDAAPIAPAPVSPARAAAAPAPAAVPVAAPVTPQQPAFASQQRDYGSPQRRDGARSGDGQGGDGQACVGHDGRGDPADRAGYRARDRAGD